jgi:hypothetical protein
LWLGEFFPGLWFGWRAHVSSEKTVFWAIIEGRASQVNSPIWKRFCGNVQ